MGIKIRFNGKTYNTKLNVLEVNNQYVVVIDGYRIFINVTLEKPEVCSQLEILRKVIS